MGEKMSREKRSKIMRSIRSKNTKPELCVRRLLTAMGYRYRLHLNELPGRPDIAFPGRKKAIFVHGCFWHAHGNCPIARIPDIEFWRNKLNANRERDSNALAALARLGWETMTLWECELQDEKYIRKSMFKFLGPPKRLIVG